MAALTDFAENKFLDALLRAQALGAPATHYVGLFTANATDAGGGTEVTGGSYARVALTANLTNWSGSQAPGSTAASTGTDGTIENNVLVTFPAPTANWGVITGFGIFDAAAAGNLWVQAPLLTSKTVNNGDAAPSFPVSALTFQADN